VLSPNTVQYALADKAMAKKLASVKKIYTHGATTAERLWAAGLPGEHVAGVHTAEELSTKLSQTLKSETRCLWPTAAEPSFNLARSLAKASITVTRLDCYKTDTGATKSDGTAWTEQEIDALIARLSGVAAFASPSAVKGFVSVFSPARNRLKTALMAIVMGPTTAAAARSEFDSLEVAPKASLDVLVSTAGCHVK
jgi:uroporphyrinogen-III synthase